MTASAVIPRPRTLIDQGAGGAGAGKGSVAGSVAGGASTSSSVVRPVVALLDGGPDDAEVVDVALEACVRRGAQLRVVHLGAAGGVGTTPLEDDYALSYVGGAMEVARLVPGVVVSAARLSGRPGPALASELEHAAMLVLSAAAAHDIRVGAPGAREAQGYEVRSVERAQPGSDRLRLGYRLALLRELAFADARDDGSATPEDLDDAWHVGVACPPLHPETIEAWTVCSAWPPLEHRD